MQHRNPNKKHPVIAFLLALDGILYHFFGDGNKPARLNYADATDSAAYFESIALGEQNTDRWQKARDLASFY